MLELFEFEVVTKETEVTDPFVEEFIAQVLDANSLFWGGGYDTSGNKIAGAISTFDDRPVNITSIINEFVIYFDERDEINLRLKALWFDKIDPHVFEKRNLRITKVETPVDD
jgi:hypothetical protein